MNRPVPGPIMEPDLYDASVPVYRHYLVRLRAWMDAAESFATSRGLPARVLLDARLAPDMLALQTQVAIAANFALRACMPLAGLPLPAEVDVAPTFAGLRAAIDRTQGLIQALPRAAFAAAGARVLESRAGDAVVKLPAADFLLRYAQPNFFFHLTTAYAILRSQGVPLGKQDFDGLHRYPPAAGAAGPVPSALAMRGAIRRLTPADADAFAALRLAGLQGDPTAFASSHDEERAFTAATLAERLAERADSGVFGAFVHDRLVGIVALGRERMHKLSHKANIWGLYVAPQARGQGLARALMVQALDPARSVPDLRQVTLGANAGNAAAIALYASLGFRPFGREPGALLIDGVLHDEIHMVLQRGDEAPPIAAASGFDASPPRPGHA